MNISVKLARIMGAAFVLTSISLFNTTYFNAVVNDLVHSMGLLWVTGLMTFVTGCVLITLHNIWVKDWRVLITIFAWLAAIKGAVIMVFPQTMVYYQQLFPPNFLAFAGVYSGVIGLGFLYLGTLGKRYLRA